jgi:hypothetical protein
MPQIITNTAELSCNQGTATSKLNVTSQDFVTICYSVHYTFLH